MLKMLSFHGEQIIITLLIGSITLIAFFIFMRPSSDAQLIDIYQGPQSKWPAAWVDESVTALALAALPPNVPYPDYNPDSRAKRELGRQLFFERRLSRSEQISCASCHDPDLGWADGRRLAIGHNRMIGEANSPTVVNVGYLKELFWDGRATSLEEQVIASLSNPREMAAHPVQAAERIASISGYAHLFTEAFGDSQVNPERIAHSIATFMRSLRFSNTPFDRFMAGDTTQFNEAQIRGLHVFRTKGRCMNCHHGALLSDGLYHHLGTSFHDVGNFEGRYRVTGNPQDMGAFRTPPLRGAASTPPFTHSGIARDLETLIRLYEMGWWQNAELDNKQSNLPTARLSPLITPLSFTAQDLADLQAFLEALDGPMPYILPPDELR